MRTRPHREDVKINRAIPLFDMHHITGKCEQKSERKTINRNKPQ